MKSRPYKKELIELHDVLHQSHLGVSHIYLFQAIQCLEYSRYSWWRFKKRVKKTMLGEYQFIIMRPFNELFKNIPLRIFQPGCFGYDEIVYKWRLRIGK